MCCLLNLNLPEKIAREKAGWENLSGLSAWAQSGLLCPHLTRLFPEDSAQLQSQLSQLCMRCYLNFRERRPITSFPLLPSIFLTPRLRFWLLSKSVFEKLGGNEPYVGTVSLPINKE